MATKKNELNVDELLGAYEPTKKTKDTKGAKQSTNDWAEEDDEGYAFGIAKDQQGAAKKTQKKKTADKGWGDVEQAQTQTKTSDFNKIQEDEQKKKIIKKPGQAARQTGVEFGSEYFPSLGEAPTKPVPKKTEPVAAAPVQQTSNDGFTTVGPKRFMNTKKQGAGESFAPLDPNVAEKAIPVAPVREKPAPTATTGTISTQSTEAAPSRGPGIFSRKTDEPPAEVPTDSKFKFGASEGPRKFGTGTKISFKREEEKDDHEALRLQREREIEEKLQREREELARQRENRDKKFAKEGGAPGESHDGHEGKRIAKFSNPKKEAEKPAPPQPEPEEEGEPAQAKEHVEMHGALSNKAWGDGPLLKKKK